MCWVLLEVIVGSEQENNLDPAIYPKREIQRHVEHRGLVIEIM